jgi:hypothetical protein
MPILCRQAGSDPRQSGQAGADRFTKVIVPQVAKTLDSVASATRVSSQKVIM